jgi:hypothetical protein
MQVFGTLMIGLIAFNALIFVSLLFLRRSRPELLTRLFTWVVRTNSGRESRSQNHSHRPADVRKAGAA